MRTGARHDLAAVHKVEIRAQRIIRHQREACHVAGAVVRAAAPVLTPIIMSNALREWIARQKRHVIISALKIIFMWTSLWRLSSLALSFAGILTVTKLSSHPDMWLLICEVAPTDAP